MTDIQATETEVFLQTLAANFPSAIIAWNQKTEIQYWNKSAEQLFGYQVPQVKGRLLADILGKNISELLDSLSSDHSARLSSLLDDSKIIHTHWKLLPYSVNQNPEQLIVAIVEDISQLAKLEFEHQFALRSLEQVTLHINDFSYSYDLSGNFININDTAAREFGYSKEEMLNLNIKDVVLPDYHQSINKILQKDLTNLQNISHYEIQVRRKNGDTFWIEIANRLIYMVDTPVGVQCIAHNIDDRKKFEMELRENEQRFRRIFESFQDTYYEADMNGMLTLLSPSVELQYGFKPEELIGKPAASVYADPSQRDVLVKKLGEQGFVNDYEISLVNKAGEILPTSCSTRLVTDENNNPIYVQGVLRNITQRKKSEAALKNSEARFRSIFNSIPDAFLEINSFETIVNASPSIIQFHYSPEKIIGQNISSLFENKEEWRDIKNWLTTHNDIQDQESTLIKNNGVSVPISVTAYKIASNNQSAGSSICIIRDISDNKHYEHELELARDQALEASRAKSSFLANMSHELRTPLNAIIGYSELLAEDALDEGREEASNDLKKIQSSGTHLLSIISDILDLSKIEAGKLELNIDDYDIKELVKDIILTITPMAQKNNNELSCQCTLTKDIIQTDVMRLKQMLFNLLSNACKFTSDGKINLHIEEQNDEDGSWIYFKINDTGIGIKDTQMEKLFNEFTQADSTTTKKYGGTGLGLVISRRFCQLMGGNIEAKSTYGKGSLFVIKLPLHSAAIEKTTNKSHKSA